MTRLRQHGHLKRFTGEATVDVEISAEDLKDAGWHHEDDCPSAAAIPPRTPVADALASLHRQAHPSQHADPAVCREEPCRSLTLDQLRGAS